MALSRRLRYEILRRDNYACRYCGASAPDVPLTVDHVTPTALGGSGDPTNLVTACQPCNAGKSASAPDAPVVADVAADALRWARAQSAAVEVLRLELADKKANREHVAHEWSYWTYGRDQLPVPRPADWEDTVDRFITAGMTSDLLTEAIRKAMAANQVSAENTWRYFCGIAWRQIGETQEVARQVAAAQAAEEGDL